MFGESGNGMINQGMGEMGEMLGVSVFVFSALTVRLNSWIHGST